jgi:hypothetical protein
MKAFLPDAGREFSIDELLSITDLYRAEDLCDELCSILRNERDALDHAKKQAAAYRQFLPPQEYAQRSEKVRVLGSMHQRLQRHVARLRKEQKVRDAGPQLDTLEKHFMEAAKAALGRVDYQMVLLIAQQRQAAQAARLKAS